MNNYFKIKGKDGTWFLLDKVELVKGRKFEGTFCGGKSKFLGAYPDEKSALAVKEKLDEALATNGRFVMPR